MAAEEVFMVDCVHATSHSAARLAIGVWRGHSWVASGKQRLWVWQSRGVYIPDSCARRNSGHSNTRGFEQTCVSTKTNHCLLDYPRWNVPFGVIRPPFFIFVCCIL